MASTVLHIFRISSNTCRNCSFLVPQRFALQVQHWRNFHATTCLRVERDPSPIFFQPNVQQLLKKLTRIDLKKVYRKRQDEHRLEPPEYKFMTTEELNHALKEAEENAQHKLQMPPVVKQRTEINEVLSKDPALNGLTESKLMFTDITYGIPDTERIIVIRDPDGTLRKASWEERYRMNQVYFPVPGRKITTPKMFEEENFKRLLEEEKYEFTLDRTCVQFEPDDPEYIRLVTATYDHIDSNRKYEALRSTRHFGPLAFHLAWSKCIDNLLLDVIHFDRIDEAVCLIKLYHYVNPDAKSASAVHTDNLAFIKSYVELDCLKRSTLELAIQTYSELLKQRQDVEEGVQKAHGH